ncbi:RNA pseudouridine synthase [Solemya pervernicosa gill symbiont]|uniref:RNA pseudouridine synthase n=2 Tax=Gammaproteobacteria incertae sedis TaxID=118884 RepID=A0A1T2KZF8_9GAMM|nr:pseudouridine synthase [Candidatus Reidiella endopervernicosa]OOZ38184.1 RNA pseudouridine synthase [Solemya pervernicosa gill symbiont]QKQ26433.1 RluA family pseudouridine synthase [Candidatus Reidiella endopervernicosa]
MQPQADPFIAPRCNEEIEVLYQDEHLLLINKPSGLLTLSGKHPLNKDSVHFRLVKEFPTATMIHRLDFGTSGILIVALNKSVNAHVGKQFQARTVAKEYTAILHGDVVADSGCIDRPIAKDRANFPLQKICYESGKIAVSHFDVVERLQNPVTTRVTFRPLSGRTHQLRIHSRELGHPILGCDLYATDEAFFMAERLMLHATYIEFDHPVSGERIKGYSPCPF